MPCNGKNGHRNKHVELVDNYTEDCFVMTLSFVPQTSRKWSLYTAGAEAEVLESADQITNETGQIFCQ